MRFNRSLKNAKVIYYRFALVLFISNISGSVYRKLLHSKESEILAILYKSKLFLNEKKKRNELTWDR